MTPRPRLLTPLVIIPLLAGPACGQARGPASPAGWIEHKDALGFTVRHPQGWQVDTTAQNLILVRAGDGTGWILAHPFLLQKPSSSNEWLAQSPGQFASVLPRAKVVRPAQRSQKPDEALASVQFVREGAPWQATLLCSIQGRAGMLYGIAAPAAQFAARRALLVQVLQTLKFTQPSAKPGAAAEAQYVRWQDPREGAFSVEVPQGWRVDGGMFRFSTADVRGALEMESPTSTSLRSWSTDCLGLVQSFLVPTRRSVIRAMAALPMVRSLESRVREDAAKRRAMAAAAERV